MCDEQFHANFGHECFGMSVCVLRDFHDYVAMQLKMQTKKRTKLKIA